MNFSSLELKVPPVIVVAVAACLMWAIAWALPSLDMALPGRTPAAVLSALFVFVGHMNRFQIVAEERALASLFGDAFKAYRSKVRRWL